MIAGGCGRETPASLRKAPLSDRQEGAEAMRGVCLTQSCFNFQGRPASALLADIADDT
jgi:hypothetical protein